MHFYNKGWSILLSVLTSAVTDRFLVNLGMLKLFYSFKLSEIIRDNPVFCSQIPPPPPYFDFFEIILAPVEGSNPARPQLNLFPNSAGLTAWGSYPVGPILTPFTNPVEQNKLYQLEI